MRQGSFSGSEVCKGDIGLSIASAEIVIKDDGSVEGAAGEADALVAGYQSEEEYRAAGLTLLYNRIYSYLQAHPYLQPQGDFINGLSAVDALFNVGVGGIRMLSEDYETGLRLALTPRETE